MDNLDKLFFIVRALNKKYPDGDNPFQIVARLREEAGELAKEVNHAEGTGVKIQKYGNSEKLKIALEAQDVIRCALALVLKYGVGKEFLKSIDDSVLKMEQYLHEQKNMVG